jgi:TPR repeat protein
MLVAGAGSSGSSQHPQSTLMGDPLDIQDANMLHPAYSYSAKRSPKSSVAVHSDSMPTNIQNGELRTGAHACSVDYPLNSDWPNQHAKQAIDPAASALTPVEYLHMGIQHHEASRLEESAVCFSRSAEEQGGCGLGMLMWGLSLRHGWGCPQDEKAAFQWLKKAADLAKIEVESGLDGAQVHVAAVSVTLGH